MKWQDMTDAEKEHQRQLVRNYFQTAERYSLTLTKDEKKKLVADAKKNGYRSINAYIRHALLGFPEKPDIKSEK